MKFQFGDYTLDSDTRQLLFRNREVHISPKAFDVLRTLLEEHPRAVTRRELQNRLWPGVFVAEGILSVLVNEIRRALRDDADEPRFVGTLRGFGYVFRGEATAVRDDPVRHGVESSPYLLIWATRVLALAPLSNIIGREPSADVFLDVAGVSRRHARITIEHGTALIEDLGSKNGTYIERRRITSPVPLNDGDHLQIGPVVLVFRIWSPATNTETLTVGRRSIR